MTVPLREPVIWCEPGWRAHPSPEVFSRKATKRHTIPLYDDAFVSCETTNKEIDAALEDLLAAYPETDKVVARAIYRRGYTAAWGGKKHG